MQDFVLNIDLFHRTIQPLQFTIHNFTIWSYWIMSQAEKHILEVIMFKYERIFVKYSHCITMVLYKFTFIAPASSQATTALTAWCKKCPGQGAASSLSQRHPAPGTFLQDFKLTWCPAGGWWRVSPWLRSDETAQSGLLLIRRIVNSLNCQDFRAISEWVWSKEARTRTLHTYHHHFLQLAYLNLKWEADWKQTWQLTKGGKYIFQSILSFVVLPSSILDILIPSIFLASWIALFLLGALPPATTDCISVSLNRNLTVDSV